LRSLKKRRRRRRKKRKEERGRVSLVINKIKNERKGRERG
jgi:hypothetical protein